MGLYDGVLGADAPKEDSGGGISVPSSSTVDAQLTSIRPPAAAFAFRPSARPRPASKPRAKRLPAASHPSPPPNTAAAVAAAASGDARPPAAGAATEGSLMLQWEDEYDPLTPNNLSQILAQRAEAAEAARRSRDAGIIRDQIAQNERFARMNKPKADASAVTDISGEEAYRRRAARSGVAHSASQSRESRVIVLLGMAEAGSAVPHLRRDVESECAKLGDVVSCRIEEGREVRVFVQFAYLDGAQRAVKALNGRPFARRPVVCKMYPEDGFVMGRFDLDC